jgi:hypothetical protein
VPSPRGTVTPPIVGAASARTLDASPAWTCAACCVRRPCRRHPGCHRGHPDLRPDDRDRRRSRPHRHQDRDRRSRRLPDDRHPRRDGRGRHRGPGDRPDERPRCGRASCPATGARHRGGGHQGHRHRSAHPAADRGSGDGAYLGWPQRGCCPGAGRRDRHPRGCGPCPGSGRRGCCPGAAHPDEARPDAPHGRPGLPAPGAVPPDAGPEWHHAARERTAPRCSAPTAQLREPGPEQRSPEQRPPGRREPARRRSGRRVRAWTAPGHSP